MKLLKLTSVVLAALTLASSMAAFAQADSTMRRSWTPAVKQDPVTTGSTGWSGGTLTRPAPPGGNIPPEIGCSQPGHSFENTTNAAAAISLQANDSGTWIASYLMTGPNTWSQIGFAFERTAFSVVPARSIYCLISESDRVQWRVGAFGDGLLETDYAKPVTSTYVVAGTCDKPATPGECVVSENGTACAPDTPAYSTPSYKLAFSSAKMGALYCTVGGCASNYSGLAAAAGATSCR